MVTPILSRRIKNPKQDRVDRSTVNGWGRLLTGKKDGRCMAGKRGRGEEGKKKGAERCGRRREMEKKGARKDL